MLKRILVGLVVALIPAAPARAAVTPGWAPSGSLIEQRYYHSAVLLDDGRVLVAGGASPDILATAELYDPRTGTWSPAGSMDQPRLSAMMVKLRDGRVLIAGGSTSTTRLSSAEIYNPATNRWTAAGDMKGARFLGTAVLLPDGKVLVAGGRDGANTDLNTAELFDPTTGFWAKIAAFDTAASDPAAALMADGRVLMAGGFQADTARKLARTYVNGVWTPTQSMIFPRYAHQLVPLADGRVLSTGGDVGGPGYVSNTAELFDPRTNQWSQTGSMTVARYRPTVTALSTGQVLAAGGRFVEPYPGITSELFDPARGAWTAAGLLSAPRTGHTATLLQDGRVLVTGGFSDKATLATTETWTPTTSLTTDPAAAFGDAVLGGAVSGAVQVTNTGAMVLLAEDIAVGGAHAGDFAVTSTTCRGAIAPVATCVVHVRFAPTADGPRTATLTFAANTAGGRHAVPLSGRGTTPALVPAPARDSDADGVADNADRCPDTKGPATRSGCPAGLLADPSIRYTRSGKGIRVVAYYVKATTGAKVVVKCSKGCRATTTKGKGARRVRITRLNGRRLAQGARITITVSKPGRLTTTVTDRIRGGRRSEGRPRCTPIGC